MPYLDSQRNAEYDRAYYRANRDKYMAYHRKYREANRERRREQAYRYWTDHYSDRLAEQRERYSDTRRAFELDRLTRKNAVTQPTATNNHRRWTTEEDNFLLAGGDLSTMETALLLGRSYHAVVARRKRLTGLRRAN